MPFTMGGFSSGVDTEDIIDKLVKVESQPIKKIQSEKAEYNEKKDVLQKLSSYLSELDKTAKDLYGFRASYDEKKFNSSNMQIIQGSTTKFAEKGVRYVVVEELASNHKISSDPIEKDYAIPAGNFKLDVNGNSYDIKFSGGNLEKFRETVDKTAGSIVSTSIVNTTGTKSVLTIESKTNGKKGEIKITGEKEFLQRIGMVSGDKKDDLDITRVVFDTKYFYPYEGQKKPVSEDGSLKASEDGKSVDIKGVLWRDYTLPAEVEVKKGTIVEVTTGFKTGVEPDKEEESLPYKVELGPDEKTVVKGIELKGYNVSRERPIEKKPEKKNINDPMGIGIVFMDNGTRVEEIFPLQKDAKGKQEIPVSEKYVGKKITKIVFYCNDGEVSFQEANITSPKKAEGALMPKNVISEAKSSKFKVDGVAMERDTNSGINDAIKGVTLEFKGANPKENVEIKIFQDLDKSIEKIKKFVEAYNKYIEFEKAITKTSMNSKPMNSSDPNSFEKLKANIGPFSGDMTIIRLENDIKRAISSPYPSQAQKPIKTLAEIGISSGKVNSSWEKIKEGKLEIDEELLRSKIEENPEGVKDLFGSDIDGDDRIDNGFGYTVDNSLEPYIRPGKNMIATKIDLQDEALKKADEQIEKQQMHIKNYEEKLRKKFSSMEQAVTKTKSQKQWMNQQMGGGGDAK